MPDNEKLSPEERTFADQVAALREERGWSQSELSERLRQQGITYATQSTVSRIEKKTRPVRMVEAQALAHIFERPVDLMMHPDSSLRLLTTSQSIYRNGWMKYNALLDVAREAARAQHRAETNLEGIRSQFDRSEGVSSEVLDMYRDISRKLEFFTTIDLASKVGERVREAREDEETRIKRNSRSREKSREEWVRESSDAVVAEVGGVDSVLRLFTLDPDYEWSRRPGEKWNDRGQDPFESFQANVSEVFDGEHQETP